MKSRSSLQHGFTTIETLIVLAIGGLIMLILFLVVPTVQRNARNHSRKEITTMVASQIIQFKKDQDHYPGEAVNYNGGDFTEMCGFIQSYLTDIVGNSATCSPSLFESGSGIDDRDCVYVQGTRGFNVCFRYRPNASHFTTGHFDDIYIMIGHWCNQSTHQNSFDGDAPITSENGGDSTGASPNLAAYVVYTPLEKGPMLCIDSDATSF